MAGAIIACGSILLAWLVYGAAITGVGLLVQRTLGARSRRAEDLCTAFWLGWGALLVGLVFWHFVLPVDGRAAVALLATGLAGWVVQRRAVGALARRERKLASPRALLPAAIFAVSLLWMSNKALDYPYNFDSAFYHLSSIRWTGTYPIVPGLGNLHGRLAFNQTHFLYAALLDAGPWEGRVGHISSGLLLATLLGQLLLIAFRRRIAAPERIFAALMFIPVLDQLHYGNISSPSPDFGAFVMGVIVALDLLRLATQPRLPARAARKLALRIAFLGAVGVTIKLSFLAFGMGSGLTALLLVWLRHRRRRRGLALATFAAAAGLGLLVLAPWAARDVILSGYVGFPLPHVAVDVPWRVPLPSVIKEYEWIGKQALDPFRRPSRSALGYLNVWLSTRIAPNVFLMMLPMALGMVTLGLILKQRRMAAAALRRRGHAWLFLLPPAAGTLFWLATAPDPRFAGSVIWVLATGALALTLDRFGVGHRRLVAGVTAATIAVMLAGEATRSGILPAGSDRGFHPTPIAALREYVTTSGLVIYYPAGDRRACWDAPLPTTPNPRKGLRLRRPGDLGGGFLLEQFTADDLLRQE